MIFLASWFTSYGDSQRKITFQPPYPEFLIVRWQWIKWNFNVVLYVSPSLDISVVNNDLCCSTVLQVLQILGFKMPSLTLGWSESQVSLSCLKCFSFYYLRGLGDVERMICQCADSTRGRYCTVLLGLVSWNSSFLGKLRHVIFDCQGGWECCSPRQPDSHPLAGSGTADLDVVSSHSGAQPPLGCWRALSRCEACLNSCLKSVLAIFDSFTVIPG